jgi:hypothetical protein
VGIIGVKIPYIIKIIEYRGVYGQKPRKRYEISYLHLNLDRINRIYMIWVLRPLKKSFCCYSRPACRGGLHSPI